ncbi:hypothetical protein J6590_025427 [Homalodisca vitripennis]|nr:hypothetical protein J6590_025427 [Homalodisca vitripennis]
MYIPTEEEQRATDGSVTYGGTGREVYPPYRKGTDWWALSALRPDKVQGHPLLKYKDTKVCPTDRLVLLSHRVHYAPARLRRWTGPGASPVLHAKAAPLPHVVQRSQGLSSSKDDFPYGRSASKCAHHEMSFTLATNAFSCKLSSRAAPPPPPGTGFSRISDPD